MFSLSRSHISDDNYCYAFEKFKVFNIEEAITICVKCGVTTNVSTNPEKPCIKDPPAGNKEYVYKRYPHFCDWLANIQGKESGRVPNEVINTITREIICEKMASFQCTQQRG